jgi:hypothetical protein
MRTEQYFELALATSNLSEKFYRCLNNWKNNGKDERSRLACADVAERYRQAVDEQIAYLHTLDRTPEIEQTLNNLLAHREQFWKDLKLLRPESVGE